MNLRSFMLSQVFSEREILNNVTYSYIDGFHDPQSSPTPFQEQLAKDAGLTGIHGNISRSHGCSFEWSDGCWSCILSRLGCSKDFY